MPRTVVTGFGLLTAAGADAASTWESLVAGRSGIAPITLWNTDGWTWRRAAEVKESDPRKLVADRKLLKLISRADVFGLNAAAQAVRHSGVLRHRETLPDATDFNERTGVFAGAPGLKYVQQHDFFPLLSKSGGDRKKFGEEIFSEVHPMWLLQNLPNNVLAYAGIQFGFKGPNENVTNHAIGSAQAIAEAHRMIQDGTLDRALVVGYESAVEPEGISYYGAMGFLSREEVRSFDEAADGTILGQGAGALMLESLESAQARGATIHGEILGAATTSEALGVFTLRPDGEGVARAMVRAMEDAEVVPRDIGMIAAHANGVPLSDGGEASAVAAVFGDRPVPVTGFKWCVGHTLAAAGAVESILTLLSLREGRVPGLASLRHKSSLARAISVSAEEQKALSPRALVVTRGFAGLSSCLVLSHEVA